MNLSHLHYIIYKPGATISRLVLPFSGAVIIYDHGTIEWLQRDGGQSGLEIKN